MLVANMYTHSHLTLRIVIHVTVNVIYKTGNVGTT